MSIALDTRDCGNPGGVGDWRKRHVCINVQKRKNRIWISAAGCLQDREIPFTAPHNIHAIKSISCRKVFYPAMGVV